MEKKLLIIIAAVIAVVILINMSIYTIDQTKQVVVLRFGKIVNIVKEPGLHFKIPFIWTIQEFEKRLLEYDAPAREIITQDKIRLLVDNYARWRITDLRTFRERLITENGALGPLREIIYSDMRNELGKYTYAEIISEKRQEIMDQVTILSNTKFDSLGIEIIDIRIKRADLTETNKNSVFERMRTERVREANLYRSEGEEEALKIRAETDKQATIIMAAAYETAETLRGEGDAQAAAIYADAYSRDEDFYQFFQTLNAYKLTLKTQTTLVLQPDSDFLKFLMSIR